MFNEINKNILNLLYRPFPTSHKGENGRLLIIAGSKKYHGSFVLCATMAAKVVDMVYLATTKNNQELLKKSRQNLAEFIYIFPNELKSTIKEADAILIGPGILPDSNTKKILREILTKYPNKKIVIDAGALRALNLRWLHKNCIITPHAGEFKFLFKKKDTPENVLDISKDCPAVIVAKGAIDYVVQKEKIFSNHTGNAGMTKGGTGDVLTGLLAALATKNDLFLAAKASVYINGLAGDRLSKKAGFYYSASELIPEAQKILAGN